MASTLSIIPHELSNDIIQETEHRYSRSQFLRTAGSVALFAALSISVSSCDSSSNPLSGEPPLNQGNNDGITVSGSTITIDLAQLSGLSAQGAWLLIIAAQTLVVNVDGTLIRAFSSVCTHSGCDRNWQYTNQQFRCTCHDSRFTNGGVRVSGPATANLPEYEVVRNGNIVTIQKS